MRKTRGFSGQVIGGLATLLALALLAWAWRWGPLKELTSPVMLTRWAGDFATAPWAPAATIALIAACGLFGVPLSPLVVVSVVVFGMVRGALYAYVGCNLSAAAGYALGRRFGPALLARFSSERLARMQRLLRRRGFVAVLVVRFSPVGHLTLESIVAGCLRVRLIDFVAATLIGTIPGILLVAVFGEQLKRLLFHHHAGQVLGLGGLLVVALLFVWYVWYRSRSPHGRPPQVPPAAGPGAARA